VIPRGRHDAVAGAFLDDVAVAREREVRGLDQHLVGSGAIQQAFAGLDRDGALDIGDVSGWAAMSAGWPTESTIASND
jgi:hypothetical protein